MDINIREYKDTDFDEAVRLFLQVFSAPPWNDRWASEQLAGEYLQDIINTPGFIGLTVRSGARQVGLLLGNEKKWCTGSEFWIEEFCIDYAVQRQGIGTLVMDFLQTLLEKRAIKRIGLLTACNTPASDFYGKNGFETSPIMRFMSRSF